MTEVWIHCLTMETALGEFYIKWKEIGQWQVRNERQSHPTDLHRKMTVVSVFYSFSTVVLLNAKKRNEEKRYCFCSFWVWLFTVVVFFKNLICLCLAALSLHCYARPFSSCGEPRLLPNCGAWASHCGGISGCRAWTPQRMGASVVVVRRL